MGRACEEEAGQGEANGGSLHYRDPDPFTVEAQDQKLTFYPDGSDRLQALLDLIEGARRSLKLCFYIFTEDKCGTLVRDAMTAAARRGVDVDLVIDSFGSTASDEFFLPYCDAGGTYCCFSAKWTRRYLIRNHQKIAIADGKRAMIGGFNIEDGYFAAPEENGWNDLGILIEGPVVSDLERWFDKLESWTSSEKKQWRAVRRMVRDWDPGDGPVRLLVGGPGRGLSSWARCVGRDLIEGKRLDMVMAYFSPTKRLMKRIGRIASKGEARLVVAGKSDNAATVGATRSLYHYLLGRQAQVWEFGACKLHTKLIVLDDAVYFGSANFDMRSLFLNLEVMLRIEDRGLADRMRKLIDHYTAGAEEITRAKHEARSTIWNRIRWNLSWLLVSVVDYTVTRRLNLGL